MFTNARALWLAAINSLGIFLAGAMILGLFQSFWLLTIAGGYLASAL